MSNQVLAYDDFQVGHAFPPHRYRIDSTDADAFLATFDHEPVQDAAGTPLRAQPGAVRPVHPTLVGSFQPQHAAFAWPTGVLHAREVVRLRQPVYPGEQLQAVVSVKDRYLKNDRKFVVLQITIDKLENQRTAMVVERTLVWPN